MLETITLAGGCFWCTEALFKRLKGIYSVIPGYSGGTVSNPTYEQVCDGDTGHAEAIQVEFDPTQISFDKILEVFWYTHDPTTLNQQGNDFGTQYRSAIFFHDQRQKEIAEQSKEKLEKEGIYKDKIVTEIIPFTNFFIAEDYHKNYYERNKDKSYCNFVITPKIIKLLQRYKKDLKEEYKDN